MVSLSSVSNKCLQCFISQAYDNLPQVRSGDHMTLDVVTKEHLE